MSDATKFDPAVDLGTPETIERAIVERNNWCETAMQHSINEEYYRKQRDAFLRAALTNPALAVAAEQIVGEGWERLIDGED